MASREEIRTQIEQDGIEFLLAQFVDIHGSAKVKMVPASCLDDMIDAGAGFAGAAVWGVGQQPHSHDMLARIDLDSYTPLPWMPNTARFCGRSVRRRRLLPVLPAHEPETRPGRSAGRGFTCFNVGMEPEHFLVTRNTDGSIAPWNPDGVDNLAKPCYDYRSMAPAMDYLQELTRSLKPAGVGCLPSRPRRRERPVRSQLRLPGRAGHG